MNRNDVVAVAGVPVRITLACGWCSRRLDDLAGEMNTGSGLMTVASAPGRFRMLNGRPVCPECGGPLFVDDWSTKRPHTEPTHDDFDSEVDEARDLAAA
jgi:hypothetical protein